MAEAVSRDGDRRPGPIPLLQFSCGRVLRRRTDADGPADRDAASLSFRLAFVWRLAGRFRVAVHLLSACDNAWRCFAGSPGARRANDGNRLFAFAGSDLRNQRHGARGLRGASAEGKVRLTLVPAKGAFGISLKDGDVVQLDSSGHFRILGVPPGSYVLWAVLPAGMARYAAYARITVAHANVSGVTLDPQGGWTVHGHLTAEGQPDSHFQYRVIAERGDAGFLFDRVQANDVHSGDSFELKGMFPGRYRIRVEMWPRGGYIKSATFGSQDVRTHLLEIPQHQPAGTLELVASWDRVQIQGTVLGPDGQPGAIRYRRPGAGSSGCGMMCGSSGLFPPTPAAISCCREFRRATTRCSPGIRLPTAPSSSPDFSMAWLDMASRSP